MTSVIAVVAPRGAQRKDIESIQPLGPRLACIARAHVRRSASKHFGHNILFFHITNITGQDNTHTSKYAHFKLPCRTGSEPKSVCILICTCVYVASRICSIAHERRIAALPTAAMRISTKWAIPPYIGVRKLGIWSHILEFLEDIGIPYNHYKNILKIRLRTIIRCRVIL